MTYTGYEPGRSPLAQEQFGPADFRYPRLDGANVAAGLFKNGLINGAFNHWQRGSAFNIPSGNTYTADRWKIEGGAGTLGVARFAFNNDPAAPGSARYYARVNVSGQDATAGYAVFFQTMEDFRRWAGKRIVIRGWARCVSGASANIVIENDLLYGTGGSPSPRANGSTSSALRKTIALTSLWQPFSFVLDVPSLIGKVVGSNEDATHAILFWLNAGSNFTSRLGVPLAQAITVDFSELEVREVIPGFGDQIGPFERIPPDVELLRCQRYFQTTLLNLYRASQAGNFQGGYVSTRFPVAMRVPPSATYASLIGAILVGGTNRTPLASEIVLANTDVIGLAAWFNVTGAIGDYASMVLNLNAEL